MTFETQIEQLNATYAAVDRELHLYSEKANADDPTAALHLVEAERLDEEAHAITTALCSAG